MVTSLRLAKQFIIKRRLAGSALARAVLDLAGYGGQWQRRVMNEELETWVATTGPHLLDAAEISGRHFANFEWHSYTPLCYPAFDILETEIVSEFDIVICEQVLEHVWKPEIAFRNLARMLRPRGRLLISTPFLVKVHECPTDYWRFTPACLRRMAEEAGLSIVHEGAWGNRRCVRADLRREWTQYRPYRSLKMQQEAIMQVWLIAERAS